MGNMTWMKGRRSPRHGRSIQESIWMAKLMWRSPDVTDGARQTRRPVTRNIPKEDAGRTACEVPVAGTANQEPKMLMKRSEAIHENRVR
jgi:hypothetical protein